MVKSRRTIAAGLALRPGNLAQQARHRAIVRKLSSATAAYLGLLGLLAAERGLELRRSARNARRALRQGAREFGRGHYPAMVAMHAAFFPACAAEVLILRRPFPGAWGFFALGAVGAAQALRLWAIATLGERWTTRIVAAPGAPPVTTGPYRFIRHPNYLAVGIELAAVPLVHGAWLTAGAFSLANAALLAARIRAEERALGAAWTTHFARAPRFIPGGLHARRSQPVHTHRE